MDKRLAECDQEDPMHRRPLTRLASKERELQRQAESPLDQHRRLGQELLNTLYGLRHLLLALGRRLAH